MTCNQNLTNIYESLCNIRFNLFCINDCHLKEYDIVNNLICEFLNEQFCKPEPNECEELECISLIDLLIITICNIEKCSYCDKNYGYLLQIDRFKCILKNLKKLLCQLKCLPTKDCELLSKFLCILFEIIELIQNIISKINNIECLCKSHLCCKCEILECMLCMLVEEIDKLEGRVCDLGHIVLQIASLNIINCTTCTTSSSCIPKERDYLRKYCKICYSDCDCCD